MRLLNDQAGRKEIRVKANLSSSWMRSVVRLNGNKSVLSSEITSFATEPQSDNVYRDLSCGSQGLKREFQPRDSRTQKSCAKSGGVSIESRKEEDIMQAAVVPAVSSSW